MSKKRVQGAATKPRDGTMAALEARMLAAILARTLAGTTTNAAISLKPHCRGRATTGDHLDALGLLGFNDDTDPRLRGVGDPISATGSGLPMRGQGARFRRCGRRSASPTNGMCACPRRRRELRFVAARLTNGPTSSTRDTSRDSNGAATAFLRGLSAASTQKQDVALDERRIAFPPLRGVSPSNEYHGPPPTV